MKYAVYLLDGTIFVLCDGLHGGVSRGTVCPRQHPRLSIGHHAPLSQLGPGALSRHCHAAGYVLHNKKEREKQ